MGCGKLEWNKEFMEVLPLYDENSPDYY